MHLEHRAGAVGERRSIVADARAVRGADLDELRARGRHDVGDAELAADLDQLAAGDEDLLAPGERGEREHQRRGAVVHDERVLGAGERRRASLGAGRSVAPRAGRRGRPRGRVYPRPPGRGAERHRSGSGARPEVRVQDHAGRVDDAGEPVRRRARRRRSRRARISSSLGRASMPRRRRGPRDLLERRRERSLQQRPTEADRRAAPGVGAQQRVDRGQCDGRASITARAYPASRRTAPRGPLGDGEASRGRIWRAGRYPRASRIPIRRSPA